MLRISVTKSGLLHRNRRRHGLHQEGHQGVEGRRRPLPPGVSAQGQSGPLPPSGPRVQRSVSYCLNFSSKQKSHAFCAGSIFTARKIETDKQRGSKNFATVLAKRVAKTARPSPCLHCECLTDGHGASLVTCAPCLYPALGVSSISF
jgi:hypothetical protein